MNSTPYYNVFLNEFEVIYKLLSIKYKLKSFDNISIDVITVDNSDLTKAASVEHKLDGSYVLYYFPNALNNLFECYKRNGKNIYDSLEYLVQDSACREACHVAIEELTQGNANKHEDYFRKIYNSLRSKYMSNEFLASIVKSQVKCK